MSVIKLPYVVSELPKDKGVFYCHQKQFPNMPVFGSIGDKSKATQVCRMMNESKRRARND